MCSRREPQAAGRQQAGPLRGSESPPPHQKQQRCLPSLTSAQPPSLMPDRRAGRRDEQRAQRAGQAQRSQPGGSAADQELPTALGNHSRVPASKSQRRPQGLAEQVGLLQRELAEQQRQNAGLRSQVQAQQAQLASLSRCLDRLLLERGGLQQAAGEGEAVGGKEAVAGQLHAEVADQHWVTAQSQQATFPGAGSAASGANGSQARRCGKGSRQSELSGGCSSASAASGMCEAEPTSEGVSWGRTLTGRAPAARPCGVPPVDLSCLCPLAELLRPGSKA